MSTGRSPASGQRRPSFDQSLSKKGRGQAGHAAKKKKFQKIARRRLNCLSHQYLAWTVTCTVRRGAHANPSHPVRLVVEMTIGMD